MAAAMLVAWSVAAASISAGGPAADASAAMSAAAAAAGPGPVRPILKLPKDGCVYPSDHGAAADGVHDDTWAVQQAVFAAMNDTASVHVAGWHNDLAGAAVCFSPGEYLLSDTINFTHSFRKPSGMAPSMR
eukprot:SAG22_NODE_704_length_7777_cov_6.153295_2_plen_131_part_00